MSNIRNVGTSNIVFPSCNICEKSVNDSVIKMMLSSMIYVGPGCI